jgi:hypothetical protein
MFWRSHINNHFAQDLDRRDERASHKKRRETRPTNAVFGWNSREGYKPKKLKKHAKEALKSSQEIPYIVVRWEKMPG